MENQPGLFISNVKEDISFVERLGKDLLGQGFRPWFAEKDLQASEDWESAIQSAIQSSFACIFVLSPASAESRSMIQEFGYARQAGKNILPIILAPMVVPDEFSSLQEIDFSDGKYEEGFSHLLEALDPNREQQQTGYGSQVPRTASKKAATPRIASKRTGIARQKKTPAADDVQIASIQRAGLLVRVASTSRGWEQPVDGLVIPFTPQGPGGSLYKALLASLGRSAQTGLDHTLVEAISSTSSLPSDPIVLTLPEALGTRVLPNNPEEQTQILLASFADASGSIVAENVIRVIKSLLTAARLSGVHALAIPLVETPGGDGTAALRNANCMVDGLFQSETGANLRSVTILTTSPEVVQQINIRFNQVTNNRPQKLLNDKPGRDLLGIATEIEALTDAVLLRDCEPPIAVGIMGGWGTGKSTVMELMFQRIHTLRTMSIENGWPAADDKNPPDFVGHIYPITFNAWTYAKSNLWASLMYTIFFDLNRQMTLEKVLAIFDPPMDESLLVKAIYDPDYQFNPDSLPPEKREQALSLLNNSILWRNLRSYKNMQFKALMETENALALAKANREKTSSDQHKQSNQELTRQVYFGILGERLLAIGKDVLSLRIKTILAANQTDIATGTNTAHMSEEDLEQAFKELRSIKATFKTLWQAFTTNWVNMAFLVLFLLIGWFGAVWIGSVFKLGDSPDALLKSLLMLASGSLPLLRTAAAWGKRVDEKIREGQGQAQNQLANLPAMQQRWMEKNRAEEEQKVARELGQMNASSDLKVDPETKLAKLKEMADGGNLAAHDQYIALLEQQASEQRRQVGPTANHPSLLDFVRSRLDDELYENQLGLMHQVENDIEELTSGLYIRPGDSPVQVEDKKKLFPRGLPRVVLFIDDLDRCPPQRVVEVLEAIQLLLKSELFVVVIGLDTRYITLALEKEYKEILRHEGDPSGLDYIEKIIQIPYRVRPIEAGSLGKYLNAQMDIVREEVSATHAGGDIQPAQVAAAKPARKSRKKAPSPALPPIPTEVKPPEKLPPGVVKFKQEDYDDLLRCCQVAALTPRSVKRLVNVLKLIKIFWFRRDQNEPSREVKQCVMVLLALSAAYPEVMRDAMVKLEADCSDNSLATTVVLEWLSRYQPPLISNVLEGQKRNLLRDVSVYQKFNLGQVALSNLHQDTLNLVRSFSFIGDPIGESDPLRVAVQENPN